MVFRIELNIHDPILIDALMQAKGKRAYVIEKALTYYLLSKEGKKMISSLGLDSKKSAGRVTKVEKKRKEIAFDKFL